MVIVFAFSSVQWRVYSDQAPARKEFADEYETNRLHTEEKPVFLFQIIIFGRHGWNVLDN